MNTRQISISDYDYPLPDSRIAKFPLSRRDQSRLLVYDKGEIKSSLFCHLPDFLPEGSLMVFNNTRVIQARLYFHKETGALIEVFLLEPSELADYEQVFQTTASCTWTCMIGNLKKWKGEVLKRDFEVAGQIVTLTATRKEPAGEYYKVEFCWSSPSSDTSPVSFADILEAAGELPIPPYLNRKTQESDKTTYQTVYSRIKGSVAAPTAGLHFTEDVLRAVDEHSIEREEVTLHVGAGTFKPVKSETIEGHTMHTEYICVKRQTIEKLICHQACAIAVGTTSVRTLESLYYIGRKLQKNAGAAEDELCVGQWEPYEDDGIGELSPLDALRNILQWLDSNHLNALHSFTRIIIAPGYDYKIVKMLITNFHQPRSTLLLLVSAFLKGDWRRVYDYALANDFRFLSYGDSSLLIP